MNRAAEGGNLLFWLPKADPEYYLHIMAYGATTRFELGEWMTRYSIDNSLSLEIGGEKGFPAIHTIMYDKLDLMGNDDVHEDLEALVNASIESAYSTFAKYRHIPDDAAKIRGLQLNA